MLKKQERKLNGTKRIEKETVSDRIRIRKKQV
jgi:hypothetical protein